MSLRNKKQKRPFVHHLTLVKRDGSEPTEKLSDIVARETREASAFDRLGAHIALICMEQAGKNPLEMTRYLLAGANACREAAERLEHMAAAAMKPAVVRA